MVSSVLAGVPLNCPQNDVAGAVDESKAGCWLVVASVTSVSLLPNDDVIACSKTEEYWVEKGEPNNVAKGLVGVHRTEREAEGELTRENDSGVLENTNNVEQSLAYLFT